MKYFNLKFLTFFLTALLAFGVGWAGTETVTFSEQYSAQTDMTISGYTGTTFTLSFSNGTNSAKPTYYTNGSAVRMYKSNTMTVSSSKTITKIELTFSSSDGTNEITTNVGTYSSGTWTGSVSSVVFTVGGTTGNRRLSAVTVTTSDGPSLTPVTLSFPESSYTANVGEAFSAPTLTVAPAAAASEVVYSSSDTDVATVNASTGAVTIVAEGTTTITAAIDDSETYTNASASYTLTVKPDPNVLAILDFTSAEFWNPVLPIGSDNKTVDENEYSDGTYTVKIAGSQGEGYYWLSQGKDLLLGKNGAYLQLPAFDKPVAKIVIDGYSGASGKVTQNIYVGETAVSTETTSAKETHTYEIAPGYQAAGNIYTLKVTNDNNTQIQKIYIYFKEETGEPELLLTPEELTIGEAGGTLTVNGSNLGSDPGVFLINETGYSDQFAFSLQGVDEGQSWFPRTDGAVTNGKVDVTYNGYELTAKGKIGVNSNNTGDGASSIVNYKIDDIYIVGDYGINEGWNFTDGTNRMSDNGGVFTYELNVNNTNTYIAFAKKVGNDVGFNTRYVFTPNSGGNWEMDADSKNGTINVYGAQPIHFQYAGLYAIEINTNESPATFTITRTLPQVEKPKFTPNGGNFPASQTVALSCDTDGASIYYTTDESEPSAENGNLYEGEITLTSTTTLKAIAVKEGMRPSEVATATFTKTGIDNLAGVNALGNSKNFTFVGNVVVTFKGTYGNHTLVGLRDVSQNNADGHGGGVFHNTATDLTVGQVLKPGWTGKTNVYAGLTQIENADGIELAAEPAEVLPFERSGFEFTAENLSEHISEYIILRNITISDDENNSNPAYKLATWNDGTKTVVYTLFDRFSVDYEDGDYEYLIGVVNVYNNTIQVYPLELKKAQQDPELEFAEGTPTTAYVGDVITLAVNNVPEGSTLSFTCDPEGAVTFDEETGKATFNSVGEVTITANTTATEEYTAGTATFIINVEAKPKVETDLEGNNLDLVAVVGESETGTIIVSGTNLKGDITLTLNDEKGVFAIDVTSIAKNDAIGEVTVTYTPKAATGEVFDKATITIKSTDAEDVTVTLTGMATLPDPVLTVSTEALEMGTKPTDTFTVTGQNLTENVTLTVTEGTAANFVITPATIAPDEDGKVNQEVTVTYKGTSTEDEYATITVKSGTAKKEVIVSAHVLPTPEIIAEPESLTMTAVVGQTPATATFTVMASDLRGDITLTLSETEVFAIEPATIAKADMIEDGVEVTVTYTPTQAGNDNATITIASEAAESVTVTLNGTATVPEVVAAPTFSLVAGSYGEAQQLTISCATEGATILYSTDGGSTWTAGNTVNVDKDMTIMAKAEKDGYTNSATVTATYIIDIPEELPTITPFKGYYQIKNNGNGKYANIAGRKTLNFTDAPADKAGTVIWLETNDKGQVQSIRSQAADLQGYANRAMRYVPQMVDIVVNKINQMEGIEDATGAGSVLGENGLDAIMEKFNECFDYHLYVEQAQGGWRLYGKTPNMQHVVDFYRDHKDQVEAKLPKLEQFINDALDKLINKIGGSTVFTDFSLHQIWEKMGGTLTEPVDEASIMAFYREVLNNKNYVWDFAYQTAQIYWGNVKNHPRYDELKAQLGDYADYIDEFVTQVRPDFKYYVIQRGDEPDYISEGNGEIINNDPRTLWTLEPRTDFTVNIAGEQFGCPYAGGVGGYATTNYTDFAYTVPESVTAYKVASVENGVANLQALSGVIPAQTPVLLMAKEAKDYVLTLSTEAGTAVESNLLVGPDYLIKTYELKTPMVESLFSLAKGVLGEQLYNQYVAQYEYLQLLYAGTVNNKYFWGLSQDNVEKCVYTNEENTQDCVIRNLGNGEFVNDWKSPKTNKAFLVSETDQTITISTLRGDVNHDGYVNIDDVTALIDYLLEVDGRACPYCANVNCDSTVNIVDVTYLIDILLGNISPYAEGGNGN